MNIENLVIDKKDVKNSKVEINELKGKFLYLHVIEIFQSKFVKEKTFNYREISSFIKYDKCLRHILYRYFALLEEKYRSFLLEKVDIINHKVDFKKIVYTKNINNFESKLYFCITKNKVSFTDLIKMLQKNQLLDINEIKSLQKLAKIRNDIMHHNLILVKHYKKWKDVKNNIEKLIESLKLLWQFLPKPNNNGFINSINSLLKKRQLYSRINLGEILTKK